MNLLPSLILLGFLALTQGCNPAPGATNIARNGEASQNSDFQYDTLGDAKNAIDGVKDTDYLKGFCSHTSRAKDPWWKLNLKQTYKISHVVLTNRMECCSERLMGAEIRIGNNPDNNNPVCGKVTDVAAATLPFCCNGMEGQYVSVVIPGRSEFLTLCEVEVYEDLVSRECNPPPGATNIARNGEASQDSDNQDDTLGDAKNAIDGVKDTDYLKGFCSHTSGAKDPWWKLNLKQTYKISHVVLTNRMECCSERLMGAEIRIGNNPDNNNPVCGEVTDVAAATLPFCCNGMEGQYVSVVIPGRPEYLTLCEVEVYGDLVSRECNPPPGATNIARNGEASQDSDNQFDTLGDAKNAIDGVKDTDYLKGFCSHTSGAKDPWWKLNLKQTYKISHVVLTNRMECCSERLMGAEIRIGNNPDNNNPVCGEVTDVAAATLPFCCNGMEGQYVSVVIPGRPEYLTLCEVEVYGDLVSRECNPPPGATNIARNGEASQDSDNQFDTLGDAKNAIDGVKDTDYLKGFCSHTSGAKDPWWKLNLKQTYRISHVVLTNRMECCSERLMGAEIRIGNNPDNNNPVCGKVTDVAAATLSFCCNGMEGQYVSVVIPGRPEYLTLCEVEVYGDLVSGECNPPPGATNIARNGEASQDSDNQYDTLGYAKNAIDGVKDTDYLKGSCSHTSGAKDPWWKLNLKQTYKISHVVLTNRMECCSERLMGAEIRIGNNPDNNNPVCGKVTDVASPTLPFCCNGMEGQYVSVVIPGRMEFLTLCEVEVYGDPVSRECNPPPGAPNIARNGEASQDSDFQYDTLGDAKNAIDGVKDTDYLKGFCSHTSGAKDPWWKLNLKQTYKISHVVLTNRMECCSERLMGAEIRIGYNPDNNNPVCGKVTDVAAATLPFYCNGMEGQYVSVVIPGRMEVLTLCEVEVYGDLVSRECNPTPGAPNIARNGEASQDSDYEQDTISYAKNAIDGVKNTDYFKGFCSHTNQVKDPWWKLNLKQTYRISNVVLTNRMECCSERLMGAEIRIGNNPDNNNPVCGKVTDVAWETLPFCCNGMEGQYVSVVIPGRMEVLTLCEVEVYGDRVSRECNPPPGATNIARNGEASQDSDNQQDTFGYAKNAIDGVKNTNYFKGFCTHTNQVKDPWWKLNLKQTYRISHVVLTNRELCCSERLMGAEIRIGNNPDNNNPVCGKVTDVASPTLSFCCNGMEGQYVSVVIPGRMEVLTLCEVEVYGDPVNKAPEENKVCW